MKLVLDLGSNLLEDSPEAGLPCHRVIVVGQAAEPVIEDVTERLEVLKGDALDAGEPVGEVFERELERIWLVEGGDHVVKGVKEA